MAQGEVDELVALLDLEPIEVNIFRGLSPDEDRQRVFGGQVAGQALVAAARTVDAEHGTCTRCTRTSCARATRTSRSSTRSTASATARSFTTRRVVAIQHGRAIFNLSASFHRHEAGLDHQLPMPDVPDPDELPTFRERWQPFKEELGSWFDRPRPIDIRHVDWSPPDRNGAAAAVPARLVPRRRPAAGRSAAAHLRRHVRVRHDAARHDAAAARRQARRRAAT